MTQIKEHTPVINDENIVLHGDQPEEDIGDELEFGQPSDSEIMDLEIDILSLQEQIDDAIISELRSVCSDYGLLDGIEDE